MIFNTRLFSRFFWKLVSDWSFSLSALIAYYLLISLLPLILSIFAVVSLIFSDHGKFQQQIRDRLVKYFPEDAMSEVIDALLFSLSQKASYILIISLLVSLFTGSRLFIGFDDVLTIIYRIRERKILEQNILALKMIVAFVLIVPFIIIFFSISIFIERHEWFYQILSLSLGAFCTYGFFQINYLILPKRRMLVKNTWCGSLFAAISLQVLLRIFPLYVQAFMSDYVGQLGFIIVTLLLFYSFGFIFVLGAEINAYFFDGVQPLEYGIGTSLSLLSDQEEIQLMEDPLASNEKDGQQVKPE